MDSAQKQHLGNTSDILVSVIVPIYNAESYIDRCVASIKDQSHDNLEIILINDGSTDSSLSICNKLSKDDPRITIIDQTNLGVSTARNRGLSAAKGEYVTFVDIDDLLVHDAIEKMLDSAADREVDVVRTNYVIERDGTKTLGTIAVAPGLYGDGQILDIIREVIRGNIKGYVWLLLIKRKLIVGHGVRFDVSLAMMEDTKFYTELFERANSIFISDVVTYSYIINSKSASMSVERYKKNINDLVQIDAYFKSHFSGKIPNIITEINTTHAISMTSQIAAAVEYPNRSYSLAYGNLSWLSKNKHFGEFYESANFKNSSLYSRAVVFNVKHKLITAALILMSIRGLVRRYI